MRSKFRKKLHHESLEDRRLLAFLASDGASTNLVLEATDGPDEISVVEDTELGVIDVVENGENTTVLSPDVDRVFAALGDGDDSLLLATTKPAFVAAGSGDDVVDGRANEGSIVALGGSGNDVLLGGPNVDNLQGNSGNDFISVDGIVPGQPQVLPTAVATTGARNVGNGGFGNDVVLGGSDDDVLLGGPGNDLVAGLEGDDVLRGNRGNDVVLGGPGSDSIRGGFGNDFVAGGTGPDLVDGGPGNDVVDGAILGLPDGSTDRLRGGSGADRFPGLFNGEDVVEDFDIPDLFRLVAGPGGPSILPRVTPRPLPIGGDFAGQLGAPVTLGSPVAGAVATGGGVGDISTGDSTAVANATVVINQAQDLPPETPVATPLPTGHVGFHGGLLARKINFLRNVFRR